MAVLTSKRRNALKSSTFGLPGRRAYPMPDKSHAVNAKARAKQQLGKSITRGQYNHIVSQANEVLGDDE